MATRPVRWIGYGLIFAALSLVLDTETFLYTGSSPLRVPMSASHEMNLAYLLLLGGLIMVFAPFVAGMVASYAPDSSIQLGRDLENDSIELRLRRRLPLKKKVSMLPNRGLVGGVAVLLVLVPMFLMVLPQESKGIYVRLNAHHGWIANENCLAPPIVVMIKGDGSSTKMFVNGANVNAQNLPAQLGRKLGLRAHWEVFVDGDASAQFAAVMSVIDTVQSLGAKAVIMTPSLRRDIEKECSTHE